MRVQRIGSYVKRIGRLYMLLDYFVKLWALAEFFGHNV